MYEELKEKLEKLDEELSVEIDVLKGIHRHGENELFVSLCSISNALRKTIGTINIYFNEK